MTTLLYLIEHAYVAYCRYVLTWSRARVQYQITQHPRLLAQHGASLKDLLDVALDSHRYALTLQPDDADALL
jgi:hypothetical protein